MTLIEFQPGFRNTRLWLVDFPLTARERHLAKAFWKPIEVPIKGSFKAGHQNPDLPIGALILWKQPGHLWSIITDWIANYIQGLDRDSGVRFVEERDELDIEYIVAYLKGGFSIRCEIDGVISQSNSSIKLKTLYRFDQIWRCLRFGCMRRCWCIFEKIRKDFNQVALSTNEIKRFSVSANKK